MVARIPCIAFVLLWTSCCSFQDAPDTFDVVAEQLTGRPGSLPYEVEIRFAADASEEHRVGNSSALLGIFRLAVDGPRVTGVDGDLVAKYLRADEILTLELTFGDCMVWLIKGLAAPGKEPEVLAAVVKGRVGLEVDMKKRCGAGFYAPLVLAVTRQHRSNSSLARRRPWQLPLSSDPYTAWQQGRQGRHRVHLSGMDGVYESAVLFGKAVMCVTPKCGSTQWLRLALRVSGSSSKWRSPFVRDRHSNGLSYMAHLSTSEAERVWNSPEIFKFLVVRSPVVRALSAYLSSKRHAKGQGLFATFENFVAWLSTVSLKSADSHIQPQTVRCDLLHGARFDFIGRSEARAEWAPQLFELLGIGKDMTEFGDGDFLSPTYSSQQRSEAKFDSSAFNLSDGIHRASNPLFSGEHTQADGQLCEYYTPELLDRVFELYKDDVELLGYQDEAFRIRHRCGF